MKICSGYHLPSSMWEQLDELRFSVNSLTEALEFAANHPDKKIIIEILNLAESKISIDKWHSLLKETANLYLDIYDITDFLALVDDIGRYMCHMAIATYNMLYFILQYHVSDITIGEPLTFDLINVRRILDEKENRHINLRVNPVIARPSLYNTLKDIDDGIAHFFILPQHIPIFETYIDVLDILDNNITRQETLVNVYLKRSYDRELKYLLTNCESNLYARVIDPDFCVRRLSCRQVCLQGQTHWKCHYCDAQEKVYLMVQNRPIPNKTTSLSSQSDS